MKAKKNIEELYHKIQMQNKKKRTDDLEELQKTQKKKYNNTAFLIVNVFRSVTKTGKHKRTVYVDDKISQNHTTNIWSSVSSDVFEDAEGTKSDKVEGVFEDFDDAEEFVEECLEEAQQYFRYVLSQKNIEGANKHESMILA